MDIDEIIELPAEMQQHILERCDPSELRSCLQIEDLRPLVGSVLKRRPFWKDGRIKNFQEFLEGVVGTRFSTAEDVEQFLRNMEGSQEPPFPGGVVIFLPPDDGNQIDIDMFHDAFRQLVDRHSADIKKLIYCVFNYMNGDDSYRNQLANICRLSNLESLAIYHGASFETTIDSPPIFLHLYQEPLFDNAPQLTELLIFPVMEDGRTHPMESPLINYLSLIPRLVGSLEYLQFPWKGKDDTPTTRRLDFTSYLNRASIPKLKKLKTILLEKHARSFPLFFNSERTPHLEEISLLVAPTNGNMLSKSIKYLDHGASSLKSIYLNFHVQPQVTPEPPWASQNLSLLYYNWQLDYPNLKQASIDLSVFVADFDNAWKDIKEKFLQLEILTLLNNLVEDSTAAVPFQSRSYCLQLWETLPAPLREIRVPHLDLVLGRGEIPSNLE